MKRLAVSWLASGVVFAISSALLLLPSNVTAKNEVEPTVEAYQTQVAELEARIAALEDEAGMGRANPTPSPTDVAVRPAEIAVTTQPRVAPPSTKGADLPPAVAKLVAQDDPDACDAIGWVVADESETDSAHHAACGDGMAYLAACQRTSEGGGFLSPPDGHEWVLCWMNVTNFGSEKAFVSPMDFALVDAKNVRHDLDYTALAAVGAGELLSTGELPLEQQVTGYVGFDVPDHAEHPLRLEIRPTLDLSPSGSKSLVIIVDRYIE